MSDEDFPAAHSMDTEWFAVDSDGNVGYFTTGEAGAAPVSALGYDNAIPSVPDIIRVLPPNCGIEYDVDDLVAMVGGPVFNYVWEESAYAAASFSDSSSCYSILMWLTDERLLGDRQVGTDQSGTGILARIRSIGRQADSVSVERVNNSKYLLGYTDGPLPVSVLQQWVQAGLVRKAWVNHGLSVARIGIYEYEHGFENWIAGPYFRGGIPRRPIKVDQLPETLRAMIEATRFPMRSFARDATIDPREAGECSSWDASWVGLDGVVHRVEDAGGDQEEVT